LDNTQEQQMTFYQPLETSNIEPAKIMTVAGIALIMGAAVVIVGLSALNWAFS
jgi:hypothetical protein